MPVERWLAQADAVDERVLDRTAGPVLDVGCGAGRHLHALGRRGVEALGIDSSCVAVALARAGGAHVVGGSVFADVPAAGSWRTVLLLDGSLGIGASPQRLLARAASLLVPGGTVFAELDGPGRPSDVVRVRLEAAELRSGWFEWARVSADLLPELASGAGLHLRARWEDGGRWFARLTTDARRARIA